MTAGATFDLDGLVERAQRGDRDAFGTLVTRYKNLVFSVALGVLHDADAASDVTQGVFLSAWQRLSELRSTSSLPPWLRETARNQALHHLRTKVRERARAEIEPLAPQGAQPADAQLVEREQAAALEVALDQLPSDVREVLLLYYSEEQSVAQVATLLELSEDAVKKRLQRGRGSLKAEYEAQLSAKMKRVVPGAALVAAILAALDAQVQAATRPRSKVPRVVAAGAAVTLVLGGIVVTAARMQAHGTASSITVTAMKTGNDAVPHAAAQPTGVSALRAQVSAAKTTAADADPSATDEDLATCNVPRNNALMHATSSSPPKRTLDPLPDNEPTQHYLAAARAMLAWSELPKPRDAAHTSPDWKDNAAWLVAHCGTTALFGTADMSLFPMFPNLPGADVAHAWLDEVARHPHNARGHANAARFFSLVDDPASRKQARELLERASELDRDNAQWELELGEVFASEARHDRDPAANQNALGHFEHALETTNDPKRRSRLLVDSAQTALLVGEDGLANQRANEALELAATLEPGYPAKSLRQSADQVLGELALGAGHADEADRYLAAQAALGGTGSDHQLAQKLLESGHRSAVARYLDHVEDEDQICVSYWKAEIAAERTPNLMDRSACPNAR
jgi:RNA polymerase sigma-70 factor (ECF subfamily)